MAKQYSLRVEPGDNPFHPDWDEVVPELQEEIRASGVSRELLDRYDHAIAAYIPGVVGMIILRNGGTIIAEGEPYYQIPERVNNPFEGGF